VTKQASIRQVILASFIGTTIEWYDFFLYGLAAALVFNKLFFPTLNPLAGQLSAYGTYAVGFVARPLGGAVFGHYGDRIGRKTMLFWSLLLMGVATACIGLVPTYDRIGIWAPTLLVVLRFVQGFGVGGEWGGAVLLAVEHSAGEKRGLHGSWPQLGVPVGLLLSSGIFALLSARLSEHDFLAWGWRVPFLLSVVLIAVGLFVRLRVLESPIFAEVKETHGESRAPLIEVFRRHPKEIGIGMGLRFAQNVLFYIYTVFVPGYGEKSLHYTRNAMLGAVLIAAVVGIFSVPFWSWLSDRAGRRPVYIAGALGSLLLAYPCFWLIQRGQTLVPVAIVLAMIGHDMMYGPMAAYFSELFGTRVRYSGASLIYQLTAVFAGGAAPFVATLLVARYGIWSVAGYLVICCAITLVAAWLAPETHRVSLEETGRAA
jgi:MFS transporter, MHS family, shikimate and dehydroshikimate transport protein